MNYLNECVFYAYSYSYGIVENKTSDGNDIISTNQFIKSHISEFAQVTQIIGITVSYEFYLRNDMIEQKMIKNLIDNNNYLNEYVSYLLGTYDDNEFKEISKKYVKTYDDSKIHDYDIFYSINLLKNIMGNDINTDLILTTLNISPKRIERNNIKLLDVK